MERKQCKNCGCWHDKDSKCPNCRGLKQQKLKFSIFKSKPL